MYSCHYWYCNHVFKFQKYLIVVIICLCSVLITVKCVDYCCIIHDRKSDTIIVLIIVLYQIGYI